MDPDDPFRLKTVQLYDDFKISGPNGSRKSFLYMAIKPLYSYKAFETKITEYSRGIYIFYCIS